MSLSCPFDGDEFEWWWEFETDTKPLATKRARKCRSCGARIAVGDQCGKVSRHRNPGNEIEERIYGDEVPMPSWWLCETCTDLAAAVHEMGMCFELDGKSIKDQIAQYRRETT
ncbi:MAG: hypothetical protein K9K35_10035 [Rhodoferax sp.]|nr:hypothetical protein [Rhodoferax sp.]